MKIISHGNTVYKGDNMPWTFSCEHCGCVFECEYGEYLVRQKDGKERYVANCPECKIATWDEMQSKPKRDKPPPARMPMV